MPAQIEVRASDIHGQGVFATASFSAGDLIATFTGRRTCVNGDHVLWVRGDSGWEGWNGTGILRWLNHDVEPNAEFWGLDLYALHPIVAGHEITIDYGPDWIDQ